MAPAHTSPASRRLWVAVVASIGALAANVGCESYPFLPGSQGVVSVEGATVVAQPFDENVIQERTFANGSAVTTATYAAGDLTRTPLAIDFNGDGRIDPVASYFNVVDQGVVQILLSGSAGGAPTFTSLTFDAQSGACRRWINLADVAVGDIDNDGYLDLVLATTNGVVYLRHPNPNDSASPGRSTTDLRYWGAPGNCDCEFVTATTETISNDELDQIIRDTIPISNIDCYDVSVRQFYNNVEIGDMNNDGWMDIVASRELQITFTPKQSCTVDNIAPILAGSVQVLLNPGQARDGCAGWNSILVGENERFPTEPDREGPFGLMLYDMDFDGDLDVVSAASTDNNTQVAWFANPTISFCPDPYWPDNDWKQWRIGSIRDAFAIDIGDVTGDGYPDVVASGREQAQIVLFEHPGLPFCDNALGYAAPNARYEYDWDAHAIVTFETFQPLDLKLLDLNGDGVLELVVAGNNGALRYFRPAAGPRRPWVGATITNLGVETFVGLLGYGDVDGDGDLDLVVVMDSDDDNTERVSWIRNNLVRGILSR